MSYETQAITRYHEAGHAVVAHIAGAKISTVTMHGVVLAPDCPLRAQARGMDMAVVCFAGGVAARLFGPHHRSPNRGPSDSDLNTAANALAVERVGSHARSKLEAAAREILLNNSRAAHAVAKALYYCEEVSGDQVARLVAGEPVQAVLAAPPVRQGNVEPVRPAEGRVGHGWRETRNEAGHVTRVLVGFEEYETVVAATYGLTLEGLDELNHLGPPEAGDTAWIRVST